jgi:hypothetical protein
MPAIEGNRTVGERGANRRSWPEPAARGGKSANRDVTMPSRPDLGIGAATDSHRRVDGDLCYGGSFTAFAVTQVTGNIPAPRHDACVEHEAEAEPPCLNPTNPE